MKILVTLGDSLIVPINGRLRVVDTQKRKYRCHGYTTGCQCHGCMEKERYLRKLRGAQNAKKADSCQCDEGKAFQGQDTCFKCGRALARAA